MRRPSRHDSIRLGDLARLVEGEVSGDPGILIRGVSTLEEADAGDITFVANPRYQGLLSKTRASAVIVSKPSERSDLSWLIAKNPYFAFSKILSFFYPDRPLVKGISPLAYIEEGVTLGNNLSVYPFVSILKGAEIGNRVSLYPGVYIGEDCTIGDDCVFHSNVSVREGTKIGNRVILHNGVVIGSDGFGFAPEAGRYHKIPQVGSVRIEDDVEIGANVTVDRAVLGQTEIKRGTKIDNQVQIGHNVSVGEDCIIVSQVGLSGSVTLGNRVTLAGQVGVAGHLSIGDDVTVAGKSGVTKNISPGLVVAGFPATPRRRWLESQASLQHVPELRRRVGKLEEKLLELERTLERLPTRRMKRSKKE